MKYIALAAALFGSVPVTAHDFWVQPAHFRLGSPATTALTFQVGHGSEHQRSQIRAGRIMRFAALAPDGAITDLRGALHIGDDSDADLKLEGEGAHIVVLETDDHAQSHLPGGRYDAYLIEEGLTPISQLRARMHRADTEGSESYRRNAKAIVQVGPAGAQIQATKPVGLPLEIVPERSPYASPPATRLPVRVLLHGQPLAGALVKLTDLDHDAAPVETHRTDPGGRVEFALPAKGIWQLNVVWSEPQPKGADTEYLTTFASLTFGFR